METNAEQVKRRPGRPPKPKVESDVPEAPKRKPGRPPKQKTTEEPEKPKRGPGRPPKPKKPEDLLPKKIGRPPLSKEERVNRRIAKLREQNDSSIGEEILNAVSVYQWDKIDTQDAEQVQIRVKEYLALCVEKEMPPTYPGLAVALGVHRDTLTRWLNKTSKLPPSVYDEIRRSVDLILSVNQTLSAKGKIKEITSIFLMKADFGLREQSEHVVTINNSFENSGSMKEIAARYADSVPEEQSYIDVDFTEITDDTPPE